MSSTPEAGAVARLKSAKWQNRQPPKFAAAQVLEVDKGISREAEVGSVKAAEHFYLQFGGDAANDRFDRLQ